MKSNRLIVATSLSVMFLAAACASSKPAPAPQNSEAAAAAKAEKEEARAAKVAAKAGRPAPAGSKLAKITNGMNDGEVRRILGEPDSARNYETGKRWIPGYGGWSNDQSRTEFIYKGLGRITLTRNTYSGSLKVIRVDYDPNI